jgi:hypothetical protein
MKTTIARVSWTKENARGSTRRVTKYVAVSRLETFLVQVSDAGGHSVSVEYESAGG